LQLGRQLAPSLRARHVFCLMSGFFLHPSIYRARAGQGRAGQGVILRKPRLKACSLRMCVAVWLVSRRAAAVCTKRGRDAAVRFVRVC
jgi:hypothetical protein